MVASHPRAPAPPRVSAAGRLPDGDLSPRRLDFSPAEPAPQAHRSPSPAAAPPRGLWDDRRHLTERETGFKEAQ